MLTRHGSLIQWPPDHEVCRPETPQPGVFSPVVSIPRSSKVCSIGPATLPAHDTTQRQFGLKIPQIYKLPAPLIVPLSVVEIFRSSKAYSSPASPPPAYDSTVFAHKKQGCSWNAPHAHVEAVSNSTVRKLDSLSVDSAIPVEPLPNLFPDRATHRPDGLNAARPSTTAVDGEAGQQVSLILAHSGLVKLAKVVVGRRVALFSVA